MALELLADILTSWRDLVEGGSWKSGSIARYQVMIVSHEAWKSNVIVGLNTSDM